MLVHTSGKEQKVKTHRIISSLKIDRLLLYIETTYPLSSA